MSVNPPSLRYAASTLLADQPDGVKKAHGLAFDAITDLQQAIPELKSQIDSVKAVVKPTASTTTTTTTTAVTMAQAQSIAATQASAVVAQTFGTVNIQSGTAYTAQTGDYAGLITFNNAGAVTASLNPTVASQWFTAMENLGAGTVTVSDPSGGLINGAASLVLATGSGALIYRNPDGTNWSAVPIAAPSVAGGVTSLNALTGALTLTSTGATVTITPSGSTIDLEVGGGPFLPVANPTFTGVITGPHYAANGSAPSVIGGAAMGVAPTITVSGNDTRGSVNGTVGSGTVTAGILFNATFAVAYASTPVVMICPASNPAAFIEIFISAESTTGFQVSSIGAASTGSLVNFNYMVIG